MDWIIVLLVLACVFVLPFVIGNYFAKSMRLPEYGWRIGVILCSILASTFVVYVALQPEKPITARPNDTMNFGPRRLSKNQLWKRKQAADMPLLLG